MVYGDLHEMHRLIHDDTAHIDLVQAYLRAAEVVTSIGVYGAFIDRGLSLFSMALMCDMIKCTCCVLLFLCMVMAAHARA